MKTHAWQRTMGAWLFIPTTIFAGSNFDLIWIIFSFLIYLSIALTVTVGYHRLFTHGSFECSKFWHWLFGLIGCISLNSAPVHWSSVHVTHHRFSDTPEDPYDSNLKHFFRFKDRDNVKATKNELRMIREPMHMFFINHSFTLFLLYGLLMSLFGFKSFLFLFALPITTYLVTSGFHTIFAHHKGSARNLWFMEFIVPMCGEWIHKNHHDKPKDSKFNTKLKHFDMGGLLIGLIQNAKRPS
jgi:stearoyl-CoA desaturase (delta-9 desaturase)